MTSDLRRNITLRITEQQLDIIGDALAIAADIRADKQWWKKHGLSNYSADDFAALERLMPDVGAPYEIHAEEAVA